LSAGAVIFLVVPDWASADTNQNGQGPGSTALLLAAGDWSTGSPQGLWTVYVDPGGNNIYFGGVSNSAITTYVSAPISWASNTIHMISLSYSTNSALYLDGQYVASGGPVTTVPSTNVWSNGFNIGSDNAGYEQFRGVFLSVEMDNTNITSPLLDFNTNYFTDGWGDITNEYYTWLNSAGGGNTMLSPGTLNPHGPPTNADITGTNVYITNLSASNVPGNGVTVGFTIQGGSNGVPYDVFTTTNLMGPKPADSVWTWLGQGTNSGTYQLTNQPDAQSFYILGTPLLAPDGSGATVAYEALIPNWHAAETITPHDDIVVYSFPTTSSGSSESCPGAYTGYINYILAPPIWGFVPSTNATVYTASDTNRTDTKVEYVGAYGDEGCAQTTVTIPYPAVSPAYRFSIYFTNDVPSTNYTITLHGFNP
jgi:hypothetical protein